MPSQHQTSSHRIKDRVIDLLASFWPIIGFVGAAIWALILGFAVNYVYDCFTKGDCLPLSSPHTGGIAQPVIQFVNYYPWIKIIMASLAVLSLILTTASFLAHRSKRVKPLTREEFEASVSSVVTKLTKEPFESIKLKQRQNVYLKKHDLFAGRSTELDRIHNFLKTRSRGYIFVTGQSGFGKTALLANLIKPKPDAYVWYFFNQLDRDPLSNTDEDFLQQMCEQLLPYYPTLNQNEAISLAPVRRLQGLYIEMMEMEPNQRLIIVIDSIDEAKGNFISNITNKYIPRNLPKGMFIIFSARQVQQKDSEQKQDFPGLLGLPTDDLLPIRLEALPPTGIEELLRKAGGKAIEWADDPAKREQVKRVSEGDPFYLRYLVEDIANRKITLKKIEQMPKGLDDYLNGWWSQVVKDIGDTQILNLMGILVGALGPLPSDDLFRLFPDIGKSFDHEKFQRVRRFVFESRVVSGKKGELAAYTLCHARFKDYITEKKLPENTVAMYRELLRAYCDQHKYNSLYALQFYSTHLLEAAKIEEDRLKAEQLYRDLLALVDERFLRDKMQHLQSYTSVLTDLKNAMHAAVELHDRAKLLGLALAYNGLQEKAVQLADSKVIPLYARFGKPELALELTGMISDETERAKTRIAVAKELLSSKPDLVQEIIQQILVNWRRYSYYELANILAQVFDLLPEKLVTFLEGLDDSSLVQIIELIAIYRTASFDQVVAHLNSSLQERFRGVLTKALSSTESEAAQIIAQAKREGSLTEQTIDRTIHLFLTGDLTSYEKWALLHLVAAPHGNQFLTALGKVDSATLIAGGGEGKAIRKEDLLLEIGKVLADAYSVTEAKKFLFAYLEDREQVARLLNKPVSEVGGSKEPIYLVQKISKRLAAENLQAALDFFELPEIKELPHYGSEWRWNIALVLEAAAKANLEATLPIVEREWPNLYWVWAIMAEELARVDLEQALTIWHEIDPEEVDKSEALISILHNAPPELHQHALEVLEQNFSLEPHHQLYKVPVLLDIALQLKQDQPENAKALALSAIDIVRGLLEKEYGGRLKRELFLVRIIPAVAACGPDLIQEAVDRMYDITDDYGLKLLALADLLRLLARRRDVPQLRAEFRQVHKDVAEPALHTRTYPPLTDKMISDLNFRLVSEVSNERYGKLPGGKGYEVLVAFVEWLSKTSNAQLLNLYLLHHAYEEEKFEGMLALRPDYIKALLAIKTFPFYYTDVLYFVKMIEDDEVRQLTIIDLYHKLPLTMIAQQYNFIRPALDAIAWVRVAARERNLQKKQEWFEAAFIAAEKSFRDLQDDFTLGLLFQFVREVRQLDIEHAAERADQFAKRVIAEVLKIPREWPEGWKAGHLFELSDCGFRFSIGEHMAIEQQAQRSLDQWEEMADKLSASTHRYLAGLLISIARSTMRVNPTWSLKLLEQATLHAALITEQSVRRSRQQRILRCLLESGDTSMWQEAVWRSLDFGDAIFETFDLFGSTLLEMEQEAKELPLRLKEAIEWAEQLWRI